MAQRKRPTAQAHRKAPSVVGIGASAGGVTALQALFSALPPDLGLAYVVILHLAPDRGSDLPQILRRTTQMPVSQVEDEDALEPNHVYVIAPDRSLTISDHHIASKPYADMAARRGPIDLFFRSLATERGDGFAVVLSGAGSDGALGLKATKEAGSIILVQDPAEAEYPSMPNAAIASGLADIILPVHEIARRIGELAHAKGDDAKVAEQGEEESIRRILAHLRVRTGHDFSKYKRSTIRRRILRRTQVSRKERLGDYLGYLRETPEEAQALFADLLISVTSFFRDRHAFESLARDVIPQLFDGREVSDQIRIWAPGCATGEEAYSLAILLLEEAGRRDLRPELQVFASDLDTSALAIAREGRYPLGIETDVSEDRLKRYFTREADGYRVNRELRDIVLFANHSLLRDPPFSRIDLISCRNLLIYLERDLQQQVIATFHYALVPNGFLFLGSAESADHPGALFRLTDREAHIYQAVSGRGDRLPALPRMVAPTPIPDQALTPRRNHQPNGPAAMEANIHREGLEQLAPPSILVDQSHQALHLSESAGRYLQPSAGPLSADIIELARPELRLDLRTALYRAFERDEATLSMPIPVRFNGHAHRVYLQVRPAPRPTEQSPKRAIVFFIEGEALEAGVEGHPIVDDRASGETVRRLAEELRLTQARLRATHEESETTNEELRAANEELQSINEEYRSTSEELETSKEELQSVNEELQTVNNELKQKLEGVSRANSDLQNLMAATDVATLFLDPTLKIKRFTPRLTELFNVTVSDEGRPITDFTHQLAYDELPRDSATVLRDLTPIERQVQTRGGEWYLMRLRPYRTLDDKIDGVVVTFIQVTDRRRIEQELQDAKARLEAVSRLAERSGDAIFEWEIDGGITLWSRGCEALYGIPRDRAVGHSRLEVLKTGVPGGSFEGMMQQLQASGRWAGMLEETRAEGAPVKVASELELVARNGRRVVLETARPAAS